MPHADPRRLTPLVLLTGPRPGRALGRAGAPPGSATRRSCASPAGGTDPASDRAGSLTVRPASRSPRPGTQHLARAAPTERPGEPPTGRPRSGPSCRSSRCSVAVVVGFIRVYDGWSFLGRCSRSRSAPTCSPSRAGAPACPARGRVPDRRGGGAVAIGLILFPGTTASACPPRATWDAASTRRAAAPRTGTPRCSPRPRSCPGSSWPPGAGPVGRGLVRRLDRPPPARHRRGVAPTAAIFVFCAVLGSGRVPRSSVRRCSPAAALVVRGRPAGGVARSGTRRGCPATGPRRTAAAAVGRRRRRCGRRARRRGRRAPAPGRRRRGRRRLAERQPRRRPRGSPSAPWSS